MANLSNINGKFVVEQTTGFVGIGTTDPGFLIEAAGTNAELALNASSIYRIRSTASDEFIITKNGVGDRLTISSGGDVGIGISAPTTKLHIGGTAPLDSIIRQDSTASGTNWEIGERVAGKWQIWEDDGDTVVTTFMSTGNVGIGTDAPQNILHLKSNDPKLILEDGNAGTNEKVYAIYPAGSQYVLQTQTDAFGAGQNAYVVDRTGTAVDTHKWYTANTERMRITSGGNVGIGGGTIEGKLSIDYTAAELPTSGTTSNSAIQVTSSLGNQLNLGLNTATENYGAYIQTSDNNLAVPYPLHLQPNGGNVAIGGSLPTNGYTASGGGWRMLQIGQSSQIAAYGTDDEIAICQNTYLNTSGVMQGIIASVPGAAMIMYDGKSYFKTYATAADKSQTTITSMFIDTTGFVGVGTTTANKIVNFADPAQGGEALKLHFEANSGADKWAIYAFDRTNSHYANMSLGENAIWIGDNKKIGISTTNPSTPLEVAGAITLNGSAAGGTATYFDWRNNGSTFAYSGSHAAIIGGGGANNFSPGWCTGANNLVFGTTNKERLRVESGGNVRVNFNESGTTGNLYFQDIDNGASMFYIQPAIYTGTSPYNVNYINAANSSNIGFITGGSERVRVATDGNVGIGTADSASASDVNAKLHIYKQATDNTVVELLRLDCGENNHNVGKGGAIVFRDINVYNDTAKIIAQRTSNGGSSTLQFRLRNTEIMVLGSGGGMQLSTYGAGTLVTDASGNITASSDSSLKTKVDKKISGLDEVLELQPRAYYWNKESEIQEEKRIEFGFFADEVKDIIPEAAPLHKDGSYGLIDRGIIAALVNSVQELKAEIEILKSK